MLGCKPHTSLVDAKKAQQILASCVQEDVRLTVKNRDPLHEFEKFVLQLCSAAVFVLFVLDDTIHTIHHIHQFFQL
jgi:hypothetical protein